MNLKEINLLSILKSAVQFFTENLLKIRGKPALLGLINKRKAKIYEIELLE